MKAKKETLTIMVAPCYILTFHRLIKSMTQWILKIFTRKRETELSEAVERIVREKMHLGKKQITLIVEKTNTGFSAYSENYPIFTTGKSIPELMNNAYDATIFYFEKENIEVKSNDIKFKIDFIETI